MTPRLARAISLTVLVAAIVSTVGAMIFNITLSDRVPSGRVFVHGDLDTPGMREVVLELRREAAAGNELNNSLGAGFNVGFGTVLVALIGWVGVGTFIVRRHPRHWAGWLFIIIGAPFPILTLFQGMAVYGMKVEPDPIPALSLVAILSEFALYPLALLPLLFLLYPDGHLPSSRWRWSVIALVGGTTVALVGFLFRPGPFNAFRDDGVAFENPLGIDAFGWGGAVIAVGTITALLAALSTPVAVIARFRRSRGDERQRMRLIAIVAGIAGALVGAMVLLMAVLAVTGRIEDDGDDPAFFPIVFGLAALTIVLGIPAAYVVAIVRHRLWDLDLVVRKAVIFAVVAGTITLATLLVVVLVPVLLIGTEPSGSEIPLIATGVAIGVLVGPVRRWGRRVADRIVFGGRATPYEVLTDFSHRVADTYATEDVLPRMARVLGEATGAMSATVSLRVADDLRGVATWPEGSSTEQDPFSVEIVHQGEPLGALSVTMPANDPLDVSKERLVRDLAAQAGPVLRNVRLIEELRASRQRLVAAQDEERRKLERDLHDGAQQQLVALQVQLRLAEQLLERDTAKALEIIHRVQGAAATALDDLRDLARGIYPPLLADQGLPAALEAQARRSAVPVTLEPDGIGRYPREIESTVYFCTLEGLNNVAKYAEATSVVVRLTDDGEAVGFEIRDDGRGFDPSTVGYGTGLRGMADRLDAVGGTLVVESSPGAGTRIVGRLPATRLSP